MTDEATIVVGDRPEVPFVEWQKIARWNRSIVITEKLDGTNAQVFIDDTGTRAFAGSRNRWITPSDDNYGFARWVADHHDELLPLGPGHHYGEWWGLGIQRRYGLTEKRFSLFNAARWNAATPPPACCHVVPVIHEGRICDVDVRAVLANLAREGSVAAPGFMNPEGIVIYHSASRTCFKMTLDKNDDHKGAATS